MVHRKGRHLALILRTEQRATGGDGNDGDQQGKPACIHKTTFPYVRVVCQTYPQLSQSESLESTPVQPFLWGTAAQQVSRTFGLEDELPFDIEQTLAAGSAKVGAAVAATHR